MLNNKFRTLVLAFVLIFALTITTYANLSARSIGLGDDFVGLTGTDALYSNPGAVNLTDDIFALEVSATAKLWNNLLKNDYISEEDKDELLEKVADDGFLLGVEGRQGAKLILGPLATVVDIKENNLVGISPDVAELLLRGNELDRDYQLDQTKGSGATYLDAGVNYSFMVPDDLANKWNLDRLDLGFTYHYLSGVIYDFEGDGNIRVGYDKEGDPTVTGGGVFKTRTNDGTGEIAGGSAIDLGAFARLNDTYSVGFSAMNIGSLTVDRINYTESKTVTNEDGEQEFKEVYNEERNEELTWKLPTTIRVGGRVDYTERIVFLTDYAYTKYNGDYKDHKFSAATELTWPKFLPLRTGVNYSTLENNFKWSAGMGLHLWFLKADLGVSDLAGFFNDSKAMETGLNLKIEF